LDLFNRAFNVRSADRRFTNDVIATRMLGWLFRTDEAFRFEVHGTWVLACTKKRRPDDLIPLFGTLQQFLPHVPRVVYELYPVA
jgi:hypothetical protein